MIGGDKVEIGSEFSNNSVPVGLNAYFELIDYPKRFVLSGRTALHLIAEELKSFVSDILLPDYCCSSMIEPFVSQGFNLGFYDVKDLNSDIISNEIDAVLIMDYFGFLSERTFEFAKQCKKKGKIIIVDATQSAFSHSKTYCLADYIVASYRKWFDSLCAVVYSKSGFKTYETDLRHHPIYNQLWRDAARLKQEYLNCSSVNKRDFLELYARANRELSSYYVYCKPNDSEIEIMRNADSSSLRNSRRENAKFLIEEIKKINTFSKVQLIFDNVKEDDCPLFVPILLDEPKRDFIRGELIKNNIYCPVHWPIDECYPHKKTSYHEKELSLICDQRYGIKEMAKQAFVLAKALLTLEKTGGKYK